MSESKNRYEGSWEEGGQQGWEKLKRERGKMKTVHHMHVCVSYLAHVYEADENISCHVTGKAKL